MVKIYVAEAKRENRREYQFIGFYTDLNYLGFTCAFNETRMGYENYSGKIEKVRYRVYESSAMREVDDYSQLLKDNFDLGEYTVLTQTDLVALFKTED